MKDLNRYIKESILDDEDDLVDNNFEIDAREWLKTIDLSFGSNFNKDGAIIDPKTLTIDLYTNQLNNIDLILKTAPPKEVKHIKCIRARIMFDLDKETIKKFERYDNDKSSQNPPILSYRNKSGVIKDLQFDNGLNLYIEGDVNKIKNLSLIGPESRHIKMVKFEGKVNIELKDLVEIYGKSKFGIVIPKKSQLAKSIEKEYSKLGFEKFNEKYKNILDRIRENNMCGIFYRNSIGQTYSRTDLMCLTSPTEPQYKHMWCQRAEYDNFNS